LVAPSILVIDRQDGVGNDTPTKREYISFTGISGNDLTGVTRGVASSTAQAHSSGALVEAIPSATHWTDLVDFLQVEHSSAGKHVLSTVTIAYAEVARLVVTSLASLAVVNVKGQFVWTSAGALVTSLATAPGDSHLPFLRARKNLTLNGVWAGLNSAPSTAAFQANISYRSEPTGAHTTLLSTALTIDVGEYESRTAATPVVLGLTSLASGTLLSPSIDAPGDGGDLTLTIAATERP